MKNRIYHLLNFINFISYTAHYNEGFILNYQKGNGPEGFFLEMTPIETYLVLANEIKEFSFISNTKNNENNYFNTPIFISGGIGKLDLFVKTNFSHLHLKFFSKSYIDDKFEDLIFSLKNLTSNSTSENKPEASLGSEKAKGLTFPLPTSNEKFKELTCPEKDILIAEEIELLKENMSNLNLKLKSNIEIESKDYFNSIYYANVSNVNQNNNTFFGEILVRLCNSVNDGIILYFSSQAIMEYYIRKWNAQGVFDTILNKKLVFVEEADAQRTAQIVLSFKKACDAGSGGVLFLTMRNKIAQKKLDVLQGNYSKALVFIGFPIETRLTKRFELYSENIKKNFEVEIKDYLNYDTFRNFATKISEKILDAEDRKILLILDEKLSSDKFKEFLPLWLKKIIHDDFDKENINTEDRIRRAKKHLDFVYDIEKL